MLAWLAELALTKLARRSLSASVLFATSVYSRLQSLVASFCVGVDLFS